MPAKWQKFDIEIPDHFTPSQRKRVADLAIDQIIRRSEEGIDKEGAKFPKYSKEYINSLDFKIAGKSKAKVDLTLSGDMLASMELLAEKKTKITIGFEKGSEENARADGNIRGTYGQSRANSAKARDFLGLPDSVLKQIIEEVDDGN